MESVSGGAFPGGPGSWYPLDAVEIQSNQEDRKSDITGSWGSRSRAVQGIGGDFLSTELNGHNQY